MMTWPQQLKLTSLRFLSLLIPRAHTGSWWLDLLYLLLIIVLQVALIPSLIAAPFVDLVTPWLAFIFIVQSTSRAMILAGIAALTLENHATIPAGFYICSYWIMGTLIVLVKKHISWRNLLPWMSTFAFAQLWIILFEILVYLVKTASFVFFTLPYALSCLLRLVLAIACGFLLSRRGTYPIAEEKNS